ncbi:hypothetical protein VKT23_011276 [Stygiomarasmius scandens]|uniref:Uncharacterized protein n=1 Tax=Marasmiellus scandens TaxID=2682957 RepID=A0ABR1J911_9AGAR
MASLTQSSFFSHPWFDKPSMKRKHSSSPENSDDSRNVDLSKSPAESRAKRPKISTIERGFSSLSIDRAHQQSAPSSSNVGGFPPSIIPADDAMDIEPTPPSSIPPSMIPSSSPFLHSDPIEIPVSTSQLSLQPSSIEEPDSPPTRDLKMRGTSWYEPEPDREHPPIPNPPPLRPSLDHVQPRSNPRRPHTGIIVTDLDSSDEEDVRDPDEPPITVSPALLERLRQRELLNHHQLSVPPASMALVLYRPLSIPSSNSDEDDSSGSLNEPVPAEDLPAVQIDDVVPMDAEPMDLDV